MGGRPGMARRCRGNERGGRRARCLPRHTTARIVAAALDTVVPALPSVGADARAAATHPAAAAADLAKLNAQMRSELERLAGERVRGGGVRKGWRG